MPSPPLLPNREMLEEDSYGRVHHHTGSAMVALPSLVSNSDGEPSGAYLTSARSQRPTEGPTQSVSPSSGARTPTTSRLQSIGEHHAATGISKGASDLLLAGWSKGTNTTYQSGWSKWILRCSEQEVDPISCGIQPFLDFLADLYEHG